MNEYLVLKWEDINTKLSDKKRTELSLILTKIRFFRASEGKVEFPQYLVLNLDDDFSLQYLFNKIALMNEKERFKLLKPTHKIKDIAVDLVNAVLKAKEEK